MILEKQVLAVFQHIDSEIGQQPKAILRKELRKYWGKTRPFIP